MKILVILSFIFCTSVGFASLPEIKSVRSTYYAAKDNTQIAKDFFQLFKETESLSGLYLGYKAASFMLLAKHAWNPYSKYSYFNQGKDLLEQAIIQSPHDVELRFLRFCIQSNSPSFLSYSSQIKEDLNFIKRHWKTTSDKDLMIKIQSYMLDGNRLSTTDKSFFKVEA